MEYVEVVLVELLGLSKFAEVLVEQLVEENPELAEPCEFAVIPEVGVT